MGLPSLSPAERLKPAVPEWMEVTPEKLSTCGPYERITVEKLIEMMKEFANTQTEPDLSDCVHVINPDRMAGLGGHTVLKPVTTPDGLHEKEEWKLDDEVVKGYGFKYRAMPMVVTRRA